MRAALLSAAALGAVNAHGGLTFPVPRNNYHNVDPRNWTSDDTSGGRYHSGGPCAGGECLWFSEGCYHGCESCSTVMPKAGNYYGRPNCNTTLEPTLPDEFVTWNIPKDGKRPSKFGDWTKFHPWRSPGHNPVSDPCGVAGAYKLPAGGGGQTPIGAKQGDRGSELPVDVVTEWKASAVQEVGFMLVSHFSPRPFSPGLTPALPAAASNVTLCLPEQKSHLNAEFSTGRESRRGLCVPPLWSPLIMHKSEPCLSFTVTGHFTAAQLTLRCFCCRPLLSLPEVGAAHGALPARPLPAICGEQPHYPLPRWPPRFANPRARRRQGHLSRRQRVETQPGARVCRLLRPARTILG